MKKYIHSNSFELESGEEILRLELAYHTFGTYRPEKNNVIWVFHAISGNSNVMDWWPEVFGPTALYNPEEHFIVCVNTIGSPYGSTKPQSRDFPVFTVRDVVRAHFLIADHLGISQIHTAIGGSFGAYQALEFAYAFEGTIGHLILMASSARESAWGIAIHESQRMALVADKTFGNDEEGLEGMKAARAIAMLTYRTSEDLIERQTDLGYRIDDFKASSYINYQGNKFSKSFDALSLFYLTKCIDSHNIGRDRGGEVAALSRIKIPTLVIGFTTDTLVPIRFQRFLAEHIPNSILKEINSEYGHDGFLKETLKVNESIREFYADSRLQERSHRVVLKFGGSSLFGKEKLNQVLKIIQDAKSKSDIAIVVSARGKSTDLLGKLFQLASKAEDYSVQLEEFREYLNHDKDLQGFDLEFRELISVLHAISLLRDDSEFAYDRVIAFGELISAKVLSEWLKKNGIKASFIDARNLIYTDKILDNFEVNFDKSRSATRNALLTFEPDEVPVITGFIASSEKGKTVTLGRNGSNYTATLIANFIQAKEVQNWTDVDGVYTANPSLVSNAIKISELTYKEANEMANFGMNLLHPKTILPLIQAKIPIIIKNTDQPESSGTIIRNHTNGKGIKAVTSIHDVALVVIEGDDLSQNIGIDARIFNSLGDAKINVKMISQASSERGLGFVVAKSDSSKTELILNEEFKDEILLGQISNIRVNIDVAIIAILGRHNFALEKAISVLRKNNIWMHLISNSISGEHISLVIDKHYLEIAIRLVHNEVFRIIRTIHVFAFGKGKVGAEFMNQILNTSEQIIKERGVEIKVVGVADSSKYILNANGIDRNWKAQLAESENTMNVDSIIKDLKSQCLNDVVLVDNTSSESLVEHYSSFVKQHFNIVASNKRFNSGDLDRYNELKDKLRQKGRSYYYEANVGAGLPIINTLHSLYTSSDVVTKIRGVFSGSLSYIFNNYAVNDYSFSSVLKDAMAKGLTEPDPREDLKGLDVARKLVILAREINFPAQLIDVQVENLIPKTLREINSAEEFLNEADSLDQHYAHRKVALKNDEVLRYIAELDVKSQILQVSLQAVSNNSPLGQIRNADTLFEIYTESYGEQPIIIQGAGAGPKVTARAVYSDVLKING